MKQVYTFHETTRGHLHVMKEIPCEDYSDSYSAEDGRYHIAIIADGHGSKECFRSSFGSQAVTEVTMECLKEFAESIFMSEKSENQFYKDICSNPNYRQMSIKRLTNTIIARWHDRVYEDYKNNPPTEEELGNNSEKYKDSSKIPKIYGTTLIAALLLPKCLILLHQGDGRCDVFYEDGTVEQPIPWDDRCEETTTTSMCDSDVSTSIRNCVLDLEKRSVIACYMGTDGVEDAYRDTHGELDGSHIFMGGVHTFYKDLTCQIATMDTTEFEEYLHEMLPKFSESGRFSHSGSGDDVSVAGIVDIQAIQKFVDPFRKDVKLYELEEELFWKEDELRGKMRKHGILKKRMEEAQVAVDKKEEEQRQLRAEISELEEEDKNLKKQKELARSDLDNCEQVYQYKDSECTQIIIPGLQQKDAIIYNLFTTNLQRFWKGLSEEYNTREVKYVSLEERECVIKARCEKLRNKFNEGSNELFSLGKARKEAEQIFEEYDAKYQAIDAERLRILSEIEAISN